MDVEKKQRLDDTLKEFEQSVVRQVAELIKGLEVQQKEQYDALLCKIEQLTTLLHDKSSSAK